MYVRIRAASFGVAVALSAATAFAAPPSVPARHPAPRPAASSVSKADLLGPAAARRAGGSVDVPLAFEKNEGHLPASVAYAVRAGGVAASFAPGEVRLATSSAEGARGTLTLRFPGARAAAGASGVRELPGTVNYCVGSDASRWRTGVRTFGAVKYANLYAGVDMVWYGSGRELEYDFDVAPGADPTRVRIAVGGAECVRVDADGNLVLETPAGAVVHKRPVAYQDTPEGRKSVACEYAVSETNEVRFALGAYDATRRLVIDPKVVEFATYLGGGGNDGAYAIAVDGDGAIYVAGNGGSGYPLHDPYQGTFGGGNADVVVSKIAPDGKTLVYSTYVGGSGADYPRDLSVDATGAVYVVGFAGSPNFPTTQGAPATTGRGFLAKLAPSGQQLVYSTRLFGDASAVAVDAAGGAYVVGSADAGMATTSGTVQPINRGGRDAFLLKANAAGTAIDFATYLGGGDLDFGNDVALDTSGAIYVVGDTYSSDFPTAGAFQSAHRGAIDVFVAKLSAGAASLVYSTYVGGAADDAGVSLAVDAEGATYVAGTSYSPNFPTANAIQPSLNGGPDAPDAIVFKVAPSGSSLAFSTYVGAGGYDGARSIALDPGGAVWVAGVTHAGAAGHGSFPTVDPLDPSFAPRDADLFVLSMDARGDDITFSTLYGGGDEEGARGLAVDASGVYVAGYTSSSDFPTTGGTIQEASGGIFDAFVLKIQSDTLAAELAWDAPASGGAAPQNLTARVVGASEGAPARPGDVEAAQGVTGYKIYRSSEPNVARDPSNFFATVPPTQRRLNAPLGRRGSYFVVSACYGDVESDGSNEAGAGTPGALITNMRVTAAKLTAKGTGFTASVDVYVDGVKFAAPATVKKLKKVVQKGALSNGQTLGQYLTAGKKVEIAFVNSDQSVTRIPFTAP